MSDLDPEYIEMLKQFRDDHSQDAAWRKFNEISRQLDLEDAKESTPEERILSCFWHVAEDPSEKAG